MAVDDIYTKLLLKFVGSDTSQVFTDEAGHTINVYGAAEITTDRAKFGLSSGGFYGNIADYIEVDSNTDLDFGSGNFTIDFWYYPLDSARQYILARSTMELGGKSVYFLEKSAVGSWRFTAENNSGTTTIFTDYHGDISSAVWHHIAVVRSGNTIYHFTDGALTGTSSTSGDGVIGNSASSRLRIGRDLMSNNYPLNGGIAELRISVGIARWTEAFTPPTMPYLPATPIDQSLTVDDSMDGLIDSVSPEINIKDSFDTLIDDVDELITVDSEILAFNTSYPETAESLTINSEFVGYPMFMETIEEVITLTESHDFLWPKTVAESLDLMDENIRAFPRTVNDILFIYDTLRHGWGLTAEESLVLTEDISNVLGLLISDWLGVIDTQSNNWNGRDVINDTLNLFDVVEKYFSIADTLEESLVLTDANNFVLTVAVLEYLGFSSLVSGMKTMAQLAEDTFAINDTATNAFIMLIEEVLQSVDVISVIANLFKTVQESLTLDEGLTLGLTIGKSVSESLTLTDVVANQGSLFTLVSDTLKMDVTVELAGEVYECYVLNTAKFMPSMYSGFNFNSYCVFENRAFGANDTGIFELTGSTDAGATIHTGAILNETDFGSRHQKRFRRGYLGISGTSPVMVMETEDGSRQVYTVDEDGKVVFQHDQKSKKWKLSVADFDTLETMQLVPIILTR